MGRSDYMDELLKTNDDLKAHFEALPAPLQRAIQAIDVGARLRDVARAGQLHIDQDALLEVEVAMALVGMQDIQKLEENIRSEVGVPAEVARALADAVNTSILQPIREELERELEHPEAKTEQKTGVEVMSDTLRAQSVEGKAPESTPQPEPIVPTGTKAVRAPASGAYKPGEASGARKDVHDDPYREPIA